MVRARVSDLPQYRAITIGLWCTEEDALDLKWRIDALICPDPVAAGRCPYPYLITDGPTPRRPEFDELYDEVEQDGWSDRLSAGHM